MSVLRRGRQVSRGHATRSSQSLQYDTLDTLMQYVGYEMLQHRQNQNVASCIINQLRYSTCKLGSYLEATDGSVRPLISTMFGNPGSILTTTLSRRTDGGNDSNPIATPKTQSKSKS